MILWISAAWALDDPAVQDHLLTVAETLRRETPDSLPPARRAARLEALDALEQYAWVGDFPDNPGFVRATWPERAPRVYEPLLEGPSAPVFVDEDGTHCAVGYLMALDAPGLVDRIDARHHTDFLAEIDTPGLGEDVGSWADSHGFTVNELAWIQPTYEPQYIELCSRLPDPALTELLVLDSTAGDCEPVQYATAQTCADTCEERQAYVPVQWNGDAPQTIELEAHAGIDLLDTHTQTLQPGEPTWVGPVTVEAFDFPIAATRIRTDACEVNTGRLDDSSPEGVEVQACPEESCGCSSVDPAMPAVWLGLLALLRRRGDHRSRQGRR